MWDHMSNRKVESVSKFISPADVTTFTFYLHQTIPSASEIQRQQSQNGVRQISTYILNLLKIQLQVKIGRGGVLG